MAADSADLAAAIKEMGVEKIASGAEALGKGAVLDDAAATFDEDAKNA